MDKKKIICNSVLLGLTILVFIGSLTGYGLGFHVFEYWAELGYFFEEGFFLGLVSICAPLSFIFMMLTILVAGYGLLRAVNVVKANAFDKPFVIVRRVVLTAFAVTVLFAYLYVYMAA